MAALDLLPVVWRIPRLDTPAEENDFVLLHISNSSTGKRLFDLKILGTEGEAVYSAVVNHDETVNIQHANYRGTDQDFERILAAVLLGAERDDMTRNIVAEAKTGKKSLTIQIQKNIEGIAQRFGEIKLKETEEEIELADWCGLAIESRNKARGELESLRKTLRGKEEETRKLNEVLEELVRLNNDNEIGLLEKFSLLLNEKKLKIRDQQRLLAAATVDPARLAAVEGSHSGARSRSPQLSRPRKRKNDAKDENDSDDGFEKMDVDIPEREGTTPDSEDERERQQTPEQSTADEDSDNDGPAYSQRRTSPPAKVSNNRKRRTSPTAKSASNGKGKGKAKEATSDIPPRRELPFAKKKEKAAPPQPAEDSETEDDEL